ncbi:MAG TPA: hypothetical protein PLJ00_04210 [Chitinophagales bacterium]|nr:hypothetical protein [Chitinophagales bacterium]HRG85154.1 hypothetical protein [Chitinophagales bacterium]
MKKIMLIICLSAFSLSAFAQNMPKAGYSGLGFNVTGLATMAFDNFGQTALSGAQISDPAGVLTGGFDITLDNLIPQNVLMYKRYYEDGLASRFSLGINTISSSTFLGDSTFIPGEYQETETKASGFSFGIGAGIEKHMTTEASKVDPFLGVDVMFAMFNGINYSMTDNITGDGYSSSATQDVSYPGGIGLGLNLLGGFNYFFSDNISIGGEVGLGFNMVNMGGSWTSDYVYEFTSNNTTTTTEVNSVGEYKNKVSGVNVNSYGGINLMVYW